MKKFNKIKKIFSWGQGYNTVLIDRTKKSWGLVSQFKNELEVKYISNSGMTGDVSVIDFEDDDLARYVVIEGYRCDIGTELQLGEEFSPIYDYQEQILVGFARRGEINYGGAKLPHIEIRYNPLELDEKPKGINRLFKTLKWVDFQTLEPRSEVVVVDVDNDIPIKELDWRKYTSNLAWSIVPKEALYFKNDPEEGSYVVETRLIGTGGSQYKKIYYDQEREIFLIVAPRGHITKIIKESDLTYPDSFFKITNGKEMTEQISFLGASVIQPGTLDHFNMMEGEKTLLTLLVNTEKVSKYYSSFSYSRIIVFHPYTGEEYEVRLEVPDGTDFEGFLEALKSACDEAEKGVIKKLLTGRHFVPTKELERVLGDMEVTREDSYASGNCHFGTEEFCTRLKIGDDVKSVPITRILPFNGRVDGVTRLLSYLYAKKVLPEQASA